jgi:hypothetical protein
LGISKTFFHFPAARRSTTSWHAFLTGVIIAPS